MSVVGGIPLTPVAAPAIESVMSGLTDAEIGRLPASIVAPAVAASRLDLSTRQNQPVARVERTQAAPPASSTPQINTVSRPSAPFLAQVIAQSSGTGMPVGDIVFNFARGFPPLVDYTVMLAFGEVKYLPSFAARPRPEPVRTQLPENEQPLPEQPVIALPVPPPPPEPALTTFTVAPGNTGKVADIFAAAQETAAILPPQTASAAYSATALAALPATRTE